jgi:hypothetical protein
VSRVADEEELLHKTGDPAANQRSGPIDLMVLPVPAYQGRAKRHCRVH